MTVNRGAIVIGVLMLAGCGTVQAHSATEQAPRATTTTTIDPATITLPPMARLPIAAPVGCVAWTVDGRFSPGAYQPGAVYVGPMYNTGDYYLSVEECAARGVTTPPHFPIESSQSPLQITDRPEHMPDFTTTNCVVWSDGVRPALIPGSGYVYLSPNQDYQIDAASCTLAGLIPPCTAPTFDQCLEAGAATNR